MAVVDPRTWLEILPEAECWRLVRLSSVGRLATVVGDEPMVWPLNIAVDGRTVVFRTGSSSTIAGLLGEPKVALEVDGLDFDACRGWSVVAHGPLRALAGDELERARRLPLARWTVGPKERWFAIVVERLSGRAIGDRAATKAAAAETTGASP